MFHACTGKIVVTSALSGLLVGSIFQHCFHIASQYGFRQTFPPYVCKKTYLLQPYAHRSCFFNTSFLLLFLSLPLSLYFSIFLPPLLLSLSPIITSSSPHSFLPLYLCLSLHLSSLSFFLPQFDTTVFVAWKHNGSSLLLWKSRKTCNVNSSVMTTQRYIVLQNRTRSARSNAS